MAILRDRAVEAITDATQLRHALQNATAKCSVRPLQSHGSFAYMYPARRSLLHVAMAIYEGRKWLVAVVLTGVRHLFYQEQEALVAELTDVAQRQRAKIGALARERAELAARPAADPAQLEALRA